MRIPITKADLKNAGPYIDHQVCLLATALKRIYGEHKIDMGVHHFAVGRRRYEMNDAQMQKLHKAYGINEDGTGRVDKPIHKTPFTIYAKRAGTRKFNNMY
jgi:hypothetical protein